MTASYITGVIRRETQFDCLAKDAYGNQATVTFTVSPQDAIVASAVGESSVEAAPGSDVEMVVEATGSGALSYAWYTCSFDNSGFEAQSKPAAVIPALNDLALLKLPAGLKTIEDEAFAGLSCEGVIIPDGCTTIGAKAFASCESLIYVRIPASVEDIAEDAFEGCELLVIDRAE